MKKFYAKLLLFGEYTIIKGSSALAIPYKRYSGAWEYSEILTQSNKILQDWCDFLEKQPLDFTINLADFRKDIGEGLSFQSNIPQGYGVGSSGALCAAFFHGYVTDFHNKKNDIFSLKNYFFQLEHFFHGGGSGIDPLICYLSQPIVFQPDGKIFLLEKDFEKNPPKAIRCFLINTGIERKTEPLVQLFLEKCTNSTYNNRCKNALAIYTNHAIQALQAGETQVFFENIQRISTFHYQYFQEMIPENFKNIWAKGIENSIYALKLCGAGGGGFILGFTEDWKKTQELLQDYQLELVF